MALTLLLNREKHKMQNCIKEKNRFGSKSFYAMIFCIILLPCVMFIMKQIIRTRFEQKKERIDFFKIKKNIKWRGYDFFYGKNSTCYHFVQIDSVFFYDSEYTKKEFSQLFELNHIKEINSEKVLVEYKHFLKVYNLTDPVLLFFQQKLSAAKVERPTVTIFIFWKAEGAFYNVKMVFFTI